MNYHPYILDTTKVLVFKLQNKAIVRIKIPNISLHFFDFMDVSLIDFLLNFFADLIDFFDVFADFIEVVEGTLDGVRDENALGMIEATS